MSTQLEQIAQALDFDQMANMAYTLNHLEERSSYDDFDSSTRYCMETLKRLGFQQVQRFALPADGTTTSFDYTMPEAWDLDATRRSFLEIVDSQLPDHERLLADGSAHPLSVLFWCPPTPPEGLTAELVDLSEIGLDHLELAAGKWLLYTPAVQSEMIVQGTYKKIADAGVAGLVFSDMTTLGTMPDDLTWYNGQGYCGWYHVKGEKRLPGFCIPARKAQELRLQLKAGKSIVLHGETYTRIYDGEIYTVTGIIPGESQEEIALLAHLYEPFVNDDAAGFAFLASLGHQLVTRGVKLKRTLRVVFSMELYGFSAYLEKYGQNVVLAANCDGLPFLESSTIFQRQTPFYNGHFSDWLLEDLLRTNLPTDTIVPEAANLSDDTFCNMPCYHGGIPTFWIHHPCERSHHSTGYQFSVDWKTSRRQLPVFALGFEQLLCLETLPDYTPRALQELIASAEKIRTDGKLNRYDKELYLQVEYVRQRKRLESVTEFTGQMVNLAPLNEAWNHFKAQIQSLPQQELRAAEYRALNIIPTPGPYGIPFSLRQVPLEEHKPVNFNKNVWALMDGKRSLLQCIKMAAAQEGRYTSSEEITRAIEKLKYAAKYGYVTLHPSSVLTTDEFKDALKQLGIANGMNVMVHCTFSSLGQVQDGPLALCQALQNAVGPDGLLMMPAFTFALYGSNDPSQCFDVRNTPGSTGILAETFRKMPNVFRSFDPCHSFSVWGKDAKKYIERHHMVPTVDPKESPLGLLHAANGYALMISCASSVTFMHLVESEFGATCCGKRDEEFTTLLPNGQRVKTRTWSWRKTTCPECPANRTDELFDIIRKRNKLKEIMLHNAHLLFFPLEEYRLAYLQLLRQACKNTAVPRTKKTAVSTDWDETTRTVSPNTTAYTGPWMPID